jgi:hypothetical protein
MFSWPLTIFCGRSFMSDMAAYSFAIWAVWLFAGWVEDRSRWRFFGAAMTMAAAVLQAIPMAYLALKTFGVSAFINRKLWLFAFLALAPSALWYSHAVEMSRSNVSLLGHPDQFLVLLPLAKYLSILENVVWWLTPGIVLLALVGLALLKEKCGARLFLWWCVGMALLVVFAGDDNYRHAWYQLPISAAVAALAGTAADWLMSKRPEMLRKASIMAALTIAAMGLIAYQSFSFVRGFYVPSAEPLRAAGEAVDALLPRGNIGSLRQLGRSDDGVLQQATRLAISRAPRDADEWHGGNFDARNAAQRRCILFRGD